MKKHLLLFCILLLTTGTAQATQFQWSVESGGNGNWYEVVLADLTWEDASKEVEKGYHLATITSIGEQNFLQELLNDTRYGGSGEFWLGAFQTEGTKDADKGWNWVTGEKWDDNTYQNWQPGEPNDWLGFDEDFLGIWDNFDWKWNDEHGNANISGYIIESYSAPVPEPTTLLLFGTGMIGFAGLSRKFKK